MATTSSSAPIRRLERLSNCFRCQTETDRYDYGALVCIRCANEGTEPQPKPVAPTPKVRDALFRELIRTTAQVNTATKLFDEVTGQLPTGRAGGTRRLQKASEDIEAARESMRLAYKRLNDFLNVSS
jgi:hypothetical protein